MKAWQVLAFALVALSSSAFAAPDDAPPKVELPLGPYVRPGRPLDVRVIGGADRVRAPGTPWALPQGERGDEFILQLTEATAGVLSLEVDRGGRVERTSMTVEVLPRDGTVVGVRGDDKTPNGTRSIRLPSSGLPTVNEGWLLLDEDVGAHDGPTRSRGLDRWIPSQRGFKEPLLFAPDQAPFEATAQAAELAPRLPGDMATVLLLLSAVEATLALLLAFRRTAPWPRAAWFAAPALGAAGFIVLDDRVPGAIRADASVVYVRHGGEGVVSALVLIRVEARRGGHARFELPDAELATSAAVLRFGPDDATVETVAAGRQIDVDLRAGENRLFAYAVTPRPFNIAGRPKDFGRPSFPLLGDGGAKASRLLEWTASCGFRVGPGDDLRESGWSALPQWMLPRAHGCAVIGGFEIDADRPTPAK